MKRTTLIPQNLKGRLSFLYLQVLAVAWMVLLQLPAFGQTILVNPDGTHSVILNSGSNTSVMVNPNGTHTVIFDNGNTQTWVNPDGTHSVMVHANTNMPVLVNPDGSHSVIVNAHSHTPVMVNPDGTHTQIIRSGNTEVQINPDGKNSGYHKTDSLPNQKPTTGSKTKNKKKSRQYP
ncbi:MAG TPA: hypothetical protein VLA46_04255 [Saprospiraceae bacterium]|nr:hypothetical protein [Saprospiraceae bacterium]